MRQISVGTFLWPVLGQGAWNMGDDPAREASETRALRLGLELGMNLIDTAEMYGGGRSESLIGKALTGLPRKTYFLVSKFYPENAGAARLTRSLEASLRRLRTDYLDAYLLHWRGAVPLEETVSCLEKLVSDGKIRLWGVSNFDVSDMEALWRVPGGDRCAVNQVLYHLGSRGIEFDLLPWLRAHGVSTMAYCPLAQGGTLRRLHGNLFEHETLRALAARRGCTTAQILLAFVLRQPHVTAIPKAANPAHTADNAVAAALSLPDEDWAAIDAIFWPPTAKMHLDIE